MTNPPIPPTSWPGEHLILPPLLDSVVQTLEDNLALPPAMGTALVLQGVSAAIGAAAVLRDDPAPPLLPGLHTIIAASPGSTLPLALDAVLAPLRVLQTQLWAFAAAEPSLLSAGHLLPAEERARRAPVIMTEDASLAVLRDAGRQVFDGTMLATFTPGAWSRLWAELAATPNGSRQRLFTESLTGNARMASLGPLRTGTLSLLAEVRPDAEAWFGFVESLSPDLCQCSLVLNLGLGPTLPRCDTALTPELASAWADRLGQLFQLRGATTPLEVTLSPAARTVLRTFHAELVASAATWPARHQELVFGWPTLARRLALLLHLGQGVDGPVSGSTAETGVALARYYGSHFLTLRDQARLQQEAAVLQADCQRLLIALQQFSSTNRRTLFRRFSGQSYSRWNRVLEHLVKEGQVVQLADDEFAVSESLLPARTSTV